MALRAGQKCNKTEERSFSTKSFTHKLRRKRPRGASSHDSEVSLSHVSGLQLFASRRSNHSLYTGGTRRQRQLRKKKEREKE